jgi:hypothetical protein
MKKSFRAIGALITWASVVIQYAVLVADGTFGGLAATTFTYLGYFTILTNILVGLAFTAPFLAPTNTLRSFFERQAVRAAIALYILVVMVVYWAVLAQIHHPVGLSAVANVGLHLVVPVLYILDWLVFAPKDKMSFKRIPLWVIYPMVYGIYTIIRGALSGVYPYPFLNVTELGIGQVSINMLGFTAFYALGGAVFIALGRILPNRMTVDEAAK